MKSIFNNPVKRKSFKEIKKEHRKSKRDSFIRNKLLARYSTRVYKKDFPKIKKYLKKRGYTSYNNFLVSKEWENFKKDFGLSKKCDICNRQGYTELHHLDYSNLLDKNSIKELCRGCHEDVHNYAIEKNETLRNTYKHIKKWKASKKEVVMGNTWFTDYLDSL